MPKLKFSRSVPFSPAQMIDLVSDLNTYPHFVPNCSDMELSAMQGEPLTSCNARMYVSFGPVNQSYVSNVRIDRQANTVTAVSHDNPFSHLFSQWKFVENGQGTHVKFDIDFEFSNRLVAAVAEPAFANIQGEILDAFIAEAKRRYS